MISNVSYTTVQVIYCNTVVNVREFGLFIVLHCTHMYGLQK